MNHVYQGEGVRLRLVLFVGVFSWFVSNTATACGFVVGDVVGSAFFYNNSVLFSVVCPDDLDGDGSNHIIEKGMTQIIIPME